MGKLWTTCCLERSLLQLWFFIVSFFLSFSWDVYVWWTGTAAERAWRGDEGAPKTKRVHRESSRECCNDSQVSDIFRKFLLMIPLVTTRRQQPLFPSAPWIHGSFSGNCPKAPSAQCPHVQVSVTVQPFNSGCRYVQYNSLLFWLLNMQANLRSVVTSAVWQTLPSSLREPVPVVVPLLLPSPRLSLAHQRAPSVAACPRLVQASVL